MAQEQEALPLDPPDTTPVAASEADKPAPTADATAAPVEPVSPEGEKPDRTFTQAELDEILQKRLAKEHRKAQREADRRIAEAIKQNQPKAEPEQPSDRPTSDKFNSTEEYVEAIAGWKAEQIVAQREAKRAEQESAQRNQQSAEEAKRVWAEQEEAALEKYDDFEQVAYNPKLHISDAMMAAIQTSDVGTDLAYFLGKNPSEAERIAKLPPLLAAKELGKLEAKLPTVVNIKTSNAPPPIRPIKGASVTTSNEPTDSDSVDAWLKKRNAQVEARLRAGRISR